ncbi:MAG: alkaline shock response membrane anchor protein AmaP [Chloroflexi bacterium]|nr:MAG: alkaline shock response membrane anchor protein AmaP [Chloroflexota bacterium]
MNVFNRIVVILLLLFSVPLLLLLIGTVVFPVQSADVLSAMVRALRDISTTTRLLIVLASLLMLIVDIVLLWFELRRPAAARTVRIKQVTGGEAELSTDSIEGRLAYNIDQLPDVIRVIPRVTGRGKGVDVLLDVETRPDIDVPAKTEQVMAVARQVVEDRMGLELTRIRVNIKHAPFPKRPRETAEAGD